METITKVEAMSLVNEFISDKLVFEEWYKNIFPHLKAIVLYGSTAKGTNRPDSDIDILIFVPLDIEEKYTKGEYFYKYKNYEINIVLRSIEKLREIAEKSNDDFQKEVFRNSEVILEKDGEVRELIQRLF